MIQTEVTVEGRTTEEAIQKGAEELGISPEEVEAEVLEKEGAGILWKSGRPAVIRCKIKQDPCLLAKAFLTKFFQIMALPIQVRVEHTELEDVVLIEGENLGFLIGRGGTVLAQLQVLVQSVVARTFREPFSFTVDCNHYLQRRRNRAVELAKDAARKVRLTGREVALDELTPYERRLVHVTLKSHPDVTSFSVGEKPNRRLIVKPR